MCIYETKIKNLKYQPSKKNNGIPPKLKDKRLEKITASCGWCKECRKKIANDWKIRLTEDIKYNKNAQFVSLSLSPENIDKLESDLYTKEWHGIETDEGAMYTDVNILAGYAVRMWSERWRKKNKKAPRHWLITELGQTNSERIHLHGIIYGNKEDISKTWQYGNVDIGDWVDERTINYIMKYVTKIDKKHNGYKQKIFVSKGLGKNYIEEKRNLHKFNEEKTITYYKDKKGYKVGLPRYYKEKLWNEEEREKLWQYTLDKNELYIDGEKIDKKNISNEKIKQKIEEYRKHNKLAGFGDNETNRKTYIITELMKMNSEELEKNKNNEIVKSIQRREIEVILDNNSDETTKEAPRKIIMGKYVGNTTKAQRDYNQLLEEARDKGVSVRVLRLIKEGIL